jgi:hypothetical protein
VTEPVTCINCNAEVSLSCGAWEHSETGQAPCYDEWPIRMGFVKATVAEPDLNDEALAEALAAV